MIKLRYVENHLDVVFCVHYNKKDLVVTFTLSTV